MCCMCCLAMAILCAAMLLVGFMELRLQATVCISLTSSIHTLSLYLSHTQHTLVVPLAQRPDRDKLTSNQHTITMYVHSIYYHVMRPPSSPTSHRHHICLFQKRKRRMRIKTELSRHYYGKGWLKALHAVIVNHTRCAPQARSATDRRSPWRNTGRLPPRRRR